MKIAPEPQELVLGAFFGVLLVRLGLHGQVVSVSFAIFAALLCAMLALIVWCHNHPSPWRWLVRRWFVVPAMLIGYWSLGPAVALVSPDRAAWLQAADVATFGGSASVALQSLARPWLTEVTSAAYILFHPFIAYGLWFHALRPGEHAARFLRTMGVLWGVGFLGYSFVPAAGPYLDTPGLFCTPLEGGWITWLCRTLVLAGSNRVDCFPSLHCAVSGAILLFEFRRSVKAGWVLTPFVAALWFSTLYLRQHYAIDVLAGAVLLAVVWALIAWWPRYSPLNLGRSK